MSSLIKLEHVSKSYQTSNGTYIALREIELTVNKNDMTAVIGQSGSGKSTLMNIIGLLDSPTTGHYYFDDMLVNQLTDDEASHIRNEKIGFIFQSFFLLPRSTILDNIMLPLFYRRTTRYDARQKALALLEKVGLATYSNHFPYQLSGGQQQRVAIARALVSNPDIILADEPTGALDSQTSDDIMSLLLTLNRDEGRTILIITHDRAISRQCSRVIEISDGRCVS